jgi:hypothetical protein
MQDSTPTMNQNQSGISKLNVWRSFKIQKQPFCDLSEVYYNLGGQNGMDVGDQNQDQ